MVLQQACPWSVELHLSQQPVLANPKKVLIFQGQKQDLTLPKGSRHDPCVAVRAVPVVEAMCALVLVDAWLMQRCARL